MAPLDGIRVLELCHFLAGPYAGLVLADLGADVLKVEDPSHPDDARSMGPHFQGGQSLYFLALNSGKRSIGVRLATDEGRAVVEDLVRHADVVIDNYRPGVLAKFGLGHDALHAVNPEVVTCSLTGYGETGAGYERTANSAHPTLVPAQNFRTADGHLALFVGNDGMWRRFVEAIDDPAL